MFDHISKHLQGGPKKTMVGLHCVVNSFLGLYFKFYLRTNYQSGDMIQMQDTGLLIEIMLILLYSHYLVCPFGLLFSRFYFM